MSTNTEILQLILDKVTKIEAAINASAKPPKTTTEAILREKLGRLTVKRHAVLTATLGGVSYQEIARLMECDVTTVKLHLKSALNLLEIASRSVLLASHVKLLDGISDKDYEASYGVPKRWWLEQREDLMKVLRQTKPPANQHTKAPTP